MDDVTFGCPDLTTFACLDELGLVVTGQLLEAGRAVLATAVETVCARQDEGYRRVNVEILGKADAFLH